MLDGWIIKILLEDTGKEDESAIVTPLYSQKVAIIRISPITKEQIEEAKFTTKYCVELLVVHELLHLIIDVGVDISMKPSASIEDIEFDCIQHQKVEQLAKSLIMAKYGLDFSWFKNF